MKPERWQRIEKLYHAAVQRQPSERDAFLDEACAGDEELRRELESLLSYQEKSESFIEVSAMEVAAELLAKDEADSAAGPETGPDKILSRSGKTISHYRILEQLGGGGMGVVYRAEDTRLGRPVALKFLPEQLSKDRQALQRFRREARAASALNHPHICTVHDIDEDEGQPFIVMEFLEGQTLKQRIASGSLKTDEILELGIQIAEALDAAHTGGITHRDIKAANIMITPRSQVKVLDFGLAKLSTLKDQAVTSETSLFRTQPGLVLGTVDYMSPEQARAQEVDHRTDIFSLGVVFYEMSTARLPFSGKNVIATIDRIVREEPEAVARYNEGVPGELERIIRKCLEKDRERRYQSALSLLVDLRNLKQNQDFQTNAGKKSETPL